MLKIDTYIRINGKRSGCINHKCYDKSKILAKYVHGESVSTKLIQVLIGSFSSHNLN